MKYEREWTCVNAPIETGGDERKVHTHTVSQDTQTGKDRRQKVKTDSRQRRQKKGSE